MAITGGSLLNSVPAAQKQTLQTNYLPSLHRFSGMAQR